MNCFLLSSFFLPIVIVPLCSTACFGVKFTTLAKYSYKLSLSGEYAHNRSKFTFCPSLWHNYMY